jgi:prepilin-type N-terminal cleavage/methylation domain-containing protein
MPPIYRNTHGFTLVELAIVLVIIGLLTGVVVGSQVMIRNAELQSIVSDYNRYKEAVTTFKKQYNAIPGDMIDAVDFWGQSTACSGGSATGTCNGDGDGLLEYGSGAGASGEAYQFWRQLALAGRINGVYSGTSGAISGYNSDVGVNTPAAKIGGVGWDAGHGAGLVSAYFTTIGDSAGYGNYFRIGKDSGNNRQLDGPFMTPEEAWKIDTKLDDGKPGWGTIIASNPVAACTTALGAGGYDFPYSLEIKHQLCGLFFVRQF